MQAPVQLADNQSARETLAVVSVSGGKDSTETAFRAREAAGIARCRFVFADTGNEHELTYDYVQNYLPSVLGAPVETVRADFVREIANKRIYCETEWPKKGVPLEIVQRALSILHPTGNPFLDMCLWKGRFPSRKAQFCTQELKRRPLDRYLIDRMAEGWDVESWRGIRREESYARRNAQTRERVAEGWTIVHPIADWTSAQVIQSLRERGVQLNPLYRLGMHRVGCMPCIHCCKDELLEIWKRFPHHIEIKREWESLVSLASKRGWTTFFTDSVRDEETSEGVFNRLRIDERVKWAQTAHGGRQLDFIRLEAPPACSSVYGLCE
jgi:3'-phosphoadenosine 5'-phosphosulfate sulfotransferase (PAPS reductase)/FAD synthetase